MSMLSGIGERKLELYATNFWRHQRICRYQQRALIGPYHV
jgi:hypothetical protein